MALVFHTDKTHGYPVEIGGVGTMGANGRGGILVERAAEVMPELQDGDGNALSGKALETAAREWADARTGVDVKSLKNPDEEKLRVDAGAFPSGRKIEDIAREAAERDGSVFEAHEENPDAAAIAPDQLAPSETASLPGPPETTKA